MDEWKILVPADDAEPDPYVARLPCRPEVTLNGAPLIVSSVKWSRIMGAPSRVWVDDVPATGHVRLMHRGVLVIDAFISEEDFELAARHEETMKGGPRWP